jgi:hypothetical protein
VGYLMLVFFMNNDPVHFIRIAFRGKPRLFLELNKILFYT